MGLVPSAQVPSPEPCKAGDLVVKISFGDWIDDPNNKQHTVRPVYRVDMPGTYGSVTLARDNPFSGAGMFGGRKPILVSEADAAAKKAGVDLKRTGEVTSCR